MRRRRETGRDHVRSRQDVASFCHDTGRPRKSIIFPVFVSAAIVVTTVLWVRSYSGRTILLALGQGDTEYLLVSGRGSIQMLRHWPWDESQTEVAWTVAWWQVSAMLGLLLVGCLYWRRLSNARSEAKHGS